MQKRAAQSAPYSASNLIAMASYFVYTYIWSAKCMSTGIVGVKKKAT